MKALFSLAAVLMVIAIIVMIPVHAAMQEPGTNLQSSKRIMAAASISPIVTEVGKISWSIDGLGVCPGTTGIIQVNKPTGATVKSAYMAAATTGWSSYQLLPGDIKIDGVDVVWTNKITNLIGSYNYWADVTSLVKAKINAAPAGRVDFTITETQTSNTDGELMVVIFDDPAQKTDNSIILMFGAQQMTGDIFNIRLAEPIDKTDPNLALDFSLASSYSSQSGSQYSIVDVNEHRMTSWAGGDDDGTGPTGNGELFTVGGLDDSTDNPADPNAQPIGNNRYDDELYSLLPFVSNGDTNIAVYTENPSNDDNLLFAGLFMRSVTTTVANPPILLVHGYEPFPFFDQFKDFYPLVQKLTGKEIEEFAPVGDMRKYKGENGNIVYVSNYTHDRGCTSKDIKEVYAKSLAQEIQVIKTQEHVNKVNIVAHSMGGLVSRAYIESGDWGTDLYKNDVGKLIMLGTPNHGTYIASLAVPGSMAQKQMWPGSEFLNRLNHGCNTCGSGQDLINPLVNYYTIAGDWFGYSGDGTVDVNSVKLSNVRNFVYPVTHAPPSVVPTLLNDDGVYQKVNEILTDTITTDHERDPFSLQAPAISLRAANGQYVCAEFGGGDGVVANRNAINAWEMFRLIDRGDGKVALQAVNGQYVCAEFGGGDGVVANRNTIGAWETFSNVIHTNYALQAANGQYLCAEGSGGGAVVANRNAINAWETFKLINRGDGNYALQATNGQYVCAEGGGGDGVVANRNAINAWETFRLIDRGDGKVALQAANGQYLCAEGSGGGAVVANRNAVGAWETFKLIPR